MQCKQVHHKGDRQHDWSWSVWHTMHFVSLSSTNRRTLLAKIAIPLNQSSDHQDNSSNQTIAKSNLSVSYVIIFLFHKTIHYSSCWHIVVKCQLTQHHAHLLPTWIACSEGTPLIYSYHCLLLTLALWAKRKWTFAVHDTLTCSPMFMVFFVFCIYSWIYVLLFISIYIPSHI
jgi:hypothetical protein